MKAAGIILIGGCGTDQQIVSAPTMDFVTARSTNQHIGTAVARQSVVADST